MKYRNKHWAVIAGSIILGLFLGWLLFYDGVEPPAPDELSGQDQGQVWTCSMHPQIRQSGPGDCPLCGMDLIPLREAVSKNPHAVHLSDYAMELADVQTMTVGTATGVNQVRLTGKVAVDERLTYTQSTHIPGRIEKLFINFTGEQVQRGQPLARIFSPEMITAQEELLQAYAIRESNPRLFEAAKQKLRSWKIGENQINSILENQEPLRQFSVFSDINGVVTEKLVEPGDYVERGTPLYQIADLSRVSVLFDIYENDMSVVKEGSKVEFTAASVPGKIFEGEIDFIDPVIDPRTRVSSARVVAENKDGILKPGMFVTGIIRNSAENDSIGITVPRSAVLWTGKRSVVYIKNPEGSFEMREVVLGPSIGESHHITRGLEKGDEVVVNGAFSVDAAAQLAGKPSMMSKKQEQ